MRQTVSEANKYLRQTVKSVEAGGVATLAQAMEHPGTLQEVHVTTLDAADAEIPAAAGLSKGVKLPTRIETKKLVIIGKFPIATQAEYDALSDAMKDKAVILDVNECPIGSEVKAIECNALGTPVDSHMWIMGADGWKGGSSSTLNPDGSTSFAGPVQAPGFINSSELPNLRSALSSVLSGVSDAQINLIGDSWTYGFYGQPGVCLPLGQILKTLLPPALNPVLGWVPLNSSSDLWPTDTWTLSASWQAAASATMGFGSACGKNATNPTGAIVFNPRETCDQIDVMFVCAPGYGSATIQATGGSPIVVDCNKSVQTFVATCSAASLALNTVSITGTGQIIVLACRARNTTKKQLYINNLGAGGSRLGRWDDPPEGYNSVDALAFTAPCLSIVQLGINDAWANTSAATFRENYETFLDQRNPAGTDYILCTPGNVNPLAVGDLGISVETLLAQYRDVVKSLGQSRGLRVIDIPSILPYMESDWADWSHPKREKYPAIAVAYSKEIF